VTTVETNVEEESKDKLDESKGHDEDKHLSPADDSGHGGKKRKKVKKSRSFKDALKEKFGKKKSTAE
jgi:hypothetical protein